MRKNLFLYDLMLVWIIALAVEIIGFVIIFNAITVFPFFGIRWIVFGYITLIVCFRLHHEVENIRRMWRGIFTCILSESNGHRVIVWEYRGSENSAHTYQETNCYYDYSGQPSEPVTKVEIVYGLLDHSSHYDTFILTRVKPLLQKNR